MARYAREGIDIPWGGAAEDGRDPDDVPRAQRDGSGGNGGSGGTVGASAPSSKGMTTGACAFVDTMSIFWLSLIWIRAASLTSRSRG